MTTATPPDEPPASIAPPDQPEEPAPGVAAAESNSDGLSRRDRRRLRRAKREAARPQTDAPSPADSATPIASPIASPIPTPGTYQQPSAPRSPGRRDRRARPRPAGAATWDERRRARHAAERAEHAARAAAEAVAAAQTAGAAGVLPFDHEDERDEGPIAVAAPAPRARRARESAPAARPGWVAFALTAVVVLCAAGAGGYFAGHAGSKPAPARATRVATAGPVQVSLPRGWHVVRATPSVGGLSFDRPLIAAPRGAGPDMQLIAGAVKASGPGILPAAFTKRTTPDRRPDPAPVRLGDTDAWRYTGAQLSAQRAVTLYAIPTASGATVAVACVAGLANRQVFMPACERASSTLRLGDALRAIPLARFGGYLGRVATATRTLSKARASGRRLLLRARTGRGQSRAAHALQTAYLRAARTVAHAKPPAPARAANAALIVALKRTSGAYRALSRAAARRERRSYAAAAAAVRSAEARVRRSVTALRAIAP